MEISVKPVCEGELNASIGCPRSRSFTNRALMIAALADGRSTLSNCLDSDDTRHMINALKQLGVNSAMIGQNSGAIAVEGKPEAMTAPKKTIFAGNSGTTVRFIAAAATLAEGRTIIDGEARMRERPIGDLEEGLRQLGAEIKTSHGFPPVTVRGRRLAGGKANLDGSLSSQYLSAMLMVAPYADNDVQIEITGDLTSKPYVDMTIDSMKAFGIRASNRNYREFSVKSGQKYSARNYFVEGDFSNASYFFAAAAVTKGRVKVTGVNPKSVQGDAKFPDLLGKMGCRVRKGKDWIEVQGGSLKGIVADMNSMPDTAQTLAVVAAFANGRTSIMNISNLRVKETDRIRATATELRKLGAKVTETENRLQIEPGILKGSAIETYNDHRMAMSFAIAGLAVKGMVIRGAECVSKTFPDFFSQLERLC